MIKELRYEVNKACNYRCVHCYTDKRKHDSLSLEEIDRLLAEVSSEGATDLSLTGGEPLLEWKHVRDIAQRAARHCMRVRINTNGHLLNDRIVGELAPLIHEFQVSLNGACAETFDEFVRVPGAFAKVVGGIRRLRQLGANVTIRYSLTAENAHELVDTFRLAEDLGVQGFKVRTVVPAGPIRGIRSSEVQMIKEAAESFMGAVAGSSVAVRFNDGGLGLDHPVLPNYRFLSCLCGTDALFVTADGDVSPCPFLREYSDWKLGSVRASTIREISESSSRLAAFVGDKAEGCGNEQGCGCRATDLCTEAGASGGLVVAVT